MSKNPMTQATQATTQPKKLTGEKFILRSWQGKTIINIGSDKEPYFRLVRMWNNDNTRRENGELYFILPKDALVFDSKEEAKALAYDLSETGDPYFASIQVIPLASGVWKKSEWHSEVVERQQTRGGGFLAADRKIREAKKEQNSDNGNGRQYSNTNGRQHHGGNKVSTAA